MPRTLRRAALVTGGWALFGFLHGSQLYLGLRASAPARPVVYGRVVAYEVACWSLWALLTPLVLWLSRRVPLAARPRPVAFHLVASLLVAPVRGLGIVLLFVLVQPFGALRMSLLALYLGQITAYFPDPLIYWAIVAGSQAIESRRALRERELQGSRVEAQLSQARLANLRLQLQPHFLFNTLHSIATLVREGERTAAVEMIVGLSDLLRYALDNSSRSLVPLGEELAITERYLTIEQTRFADRLRVVIEVAEEALGAQVPTLLLQPLVENAIRHGVATSVRPVTVEIRGGCAPEGLVLEVRDDGPSLARGWRPGIGLASTRDRLQQIYGERGRLELASLVPSGVVARVTVPHAHAMIDPAPRVAEAGH